jgi:drug/metabolite transporter (DMT)-like permease
MAVAMAGFTMNDAITKAVSAEMNFGQMMLVRGLFAIVLIAALAHRQRALRICLWPIPRRSFRRCPWRSRSARR